MESQAIPCPTTHGSLVMSQEENTPTLGLTPHYPPSQNTTKSKLKGTNSGARICFGKWTAATEESPTPAHPRPPQAMHDTPSRGEPTISRLRFPGSQVPPLRDDQVRVLGFWGASRRPRFTGSGSESSGGNLGNLGEPGNLIWSKVSHPTLEHASYQPARAEPSQRTVPSE